MDTEPFDEAELLDLPASPVVSPPRRLKRLKKSSSQPTTTTAIDTAEIPPAGSPSPPPSPPPPPAPVAAASPDEETLVPRLSPLGNSSPPPPKASDADALSPLPQSSPNPDSSPLPPTDSPDEEDDGLDPLFSESGPAAGWDPLGAPVEGDGEDEEDMLGGGLIEELRRETAAKKRLDMDKGEEEMVTGAEAKGKRSKRKRKEDAPKESARGKRRSEKERRVQLDSIHAESQRLLRETRSASFKPSVQPVYKPISSVLEKIRLRKLEILKKTNAHIEDDDDDDAPSEPASDFIGHLEVPQVKEVATDAKDLKTDDTDKELAANGHELDQCDIPEEDAKKDFDNHNRKTSNEEMLDSSQDNHDKNAHSSENHFDLGDRTQSHPSSSPTKSTDETLSEDEGEDNDKENIDPSSQENDENADEHPQQTTGDLCPDVAILKDFLDDEAEEEDDSDNDMMRFKDNEEDDGSDEDEVFNDLIEAGYKEKEVDHKKRNEFHQKWLQQQDAAETNNVMQRLKFGRQEEKKILDEDEDEDIEECEGESENEMSYDLTPANIVRQNSEKAKQMVAKMFTDDNDVYEHSDDDEIEENLARQRISKRESYNGSLISPVEDDNSREVFSLIKKLNIAPQPKRRGKQPSSNHEMLVTGKNSTTSKSSFLGRTSSGSSVSSHRSVYRSYVFGRDDSNSSIRSCMTSSESNSEIDQTNSNQPKKAKFSSSQPKPTGSRTNAEGRMSSSVSLFEILRRSSSVSSDKQEYICQESCAKITESQAEYQFSAFKLSRRFSKV